jgi:hypothetical protein
METHRMFGAQHHSETRRDTVPHVRNDEKLVGYILTPRSFDTAGEAGVRLQGRAARGGFRISSTEVDVGSAASHFREGLWRALRRLVCSDCDPRKMPFSILNFEDFMAQALRPCYCRRTTRGQAGIVVERIDHITTDKIRANELIIRLAKAGKHVIADDGICLSCCHPATKKLLGGSV